MTYEEVKKAWQADIAEKTKEIYELKSRLDKTEITITEYEAVIKTLNEQIETLEKSIEAIDKAMIAKSKSAEDPTEEGKGGFKSLGHFIYTMKRALLDRDSEALGLLKTNNDRMLTKAPTATSSQSTITGSEGGFLVPETFSAQILGDMNQYGKILQRCFQLPVSGPSVKIPAIVDYDHSSQTYYGGVSISRGNERTAISGTSADFGTVTLSLKKLVGMAGITSELARWSAISVEPILRRMFASAMAARIERELIKGDGSGQMLGVMSSPCKVAVTVESGQTSASTLLPANITKMMASLPTEATTPSWTIHPKMITYMMLLNETIGTGGSLVNWYQFGNNTFMTYPVDKSEFCYAPNSEGDIILADWSQYVYAYEAGGEQTMASPHFWFDYDTTAIRFTMYNDGQFWWKSSRLLDDGATYVSPCITLAVRS